MTVPTGPKRQGPTMLLILLIAMILDKFCISRCWPEASGLISINPMLVFLDIPLDLSLTFGLLSVTGLFIGLYLILLLPNPWKIITGMLAIPFSVLSGGMIYEVSRDGLPKQARNAIESFGINADISTSIPGHELIHLKGSMVMLCCFFIGLHICRRRIRSAAATAIPIMNPIPAPNLSRIPAPGPAQSPGSHPVPNAAFHPSSQQAQKIPEENLIC